MHKNKLKKLISLGLVTVLLLGTAGCSSGSGSSQQDSQSSAAATEAPEESSAVSSAETTENTTTEASAETTAESGNSEQLQGDLSDIMPEETLTLTVYSQLANYSGEQIGWFAKILKDRFNVIMNIIPEADGTFATRMESGDLGDIVVFGNDADDYKSAVSAGMLLDWEEDNILQDYGPYVADNMQIALEKNRSINPDNKIHGFGHNVGTSATEHETAFYHPDIRWDLYKELGYPEVNTLEDLVEVLADMQALEPQSDSGEQTYAVSLFPDWDGDMVMYVKATAALYGYDEFGFGLYDTNTNTYIDALAEDGPYLRMLKFYNTLYQRVLLDPDSMTQTSEEASEAYQTGAAFWNPFDFLGSNLYNTPEHLAEGKAMLPLPTSDMQILTYGLNINGGNRVWAIGANTAYPELCMAIINWLSTPEGVMVYQYGPQGVTWDYDDQGRPYLTDLGETCKRDGETELTGDYSGKFSDGVPQVNNTTWSIDAVNPDAKNGDAYNYKHWETWSDKDVSDIEMDWQAKFNVNSIDALFEGDQIAISVATTYTATEKSQELQRLFSYYREKLGKEWYWIGKMEPANCEEDHGTVSSIGSESSGFAFGCLDQTVHPLGKSIC